MEIMAYGSAARALSAAPIPLPLGGGEIRAPVGDRPHPSASVVPIPIPLAARQKGLFDVNSMQKLQGEVISTHNFHCDQPWRAFSSVSDRFSAAHQTGQERAQTLTPAMLPR